MIPQILGAPLAYELVTGKRLSLTDSSDNGNSDYSSLNSPVAYQSLVDRLFSPVKYAWDKIPSQVKALGAVAGIMVASACVGVAPNQSPVADLNYSADGRIVTFNASGSYDKDGNITKYEIEFGDGEKAVNGPVFKHTYAKPGNYTARIVVTDDKNMTGSKEARVEAKKLTLARDLARELGVSGKYQILIEERFDADEMLSASEDSFVRTLARNKTFSDNYYDLISPLITEQVSESDVKVLDYTMKAGNYGDAAVRDLFDAYRKYPKGTIAWVGKNPDIKESLIEDRGETRLDVDRDGVPNYRDPNLFLLDPIVDFKDSNDNFRILNLPTGLVQTFDGQEWYIDKDKHPEGMVRVDLGKTSKPENINLSFNVSIEQFYPEFGMRLMHEFKKAPSVFLDARDFLMCLGVKEAEKDFVTFYIVTSESYLKKNENKFKVHQSLGVEISKGIISYDAEKTIDFIPKESYSNIFITDYKFSFLNLRQKWEYHYAIGTLFKLFDNNDKLTSKFRLADISSMDDYYGGYQTRYELEEDELPNKKIVATLKKGGRVIGEEIWDNYYYIPPDKRHEYKIIKKVQ